MRNSLNEFGSFFVEKIQFLFGRFVNGIKNYIQQILALFALVKI